MFLLLRGISSRERVFELPRGCPDGEVQTCRGASPLRREVAVCQYDIVHSAAVEQPNIGYGGTMLVYCPCLFAHYSDAYSVLVLYMQSYQRPGTFADP